MTLYSLKPKFQALLRPFAAWIKHRGGTANQVTVLAALGSIAIGALLAWQGPGSPALFLLLPVWMFVRMALNAIDGMLAREFGDASPLGAYLNELCDQVSDAALVLPFAFIAPFSPALVVIVVLLAVLSEYAGVMGAMIGASRRYDGPAGKSDRALVFGALGLWLGLFGALPAWSAILLPALICLLALTIANRIRGGLSQAKSSDSPESR
ncbi:MAG: hypothetical protein RLZ98_2863 [Pseudomonadota bacterium]|jgi:CDP-diacylglycerol--glycerol-3-phosphate 3-phosphatidyltransferase